MCRTTTVPRTHKATQQFGAGPPGLWRLGRSEGVQQIPVLLPGTAARAPGASGPGGSGGTGQVVSLCCGCSSDRN